MRVTIENLEQLLSKGETDTIEFKRSVPLQLNIIERLISAFSNAKGGSVIFGYDEQKHNIVGVEENQINKLRQLIAAPQYKSNCYIYTIDFNNKIVAVLDVEKSKADMYVNGVAYIRREDKVFSKVGNIRSKYLKEFIKEIQYRNRNPIDIKALELMNDLSTNPERKMKQGTPLYRCRIIHDMTMVNTEPNFYGYGKKGSFVPPPNATRDMRANYRYIPYLYCANNPYTALVEVRPRLGANVSIATIEVEEEITLLDFTLKKIPKNMNEAKLNFFADLSMLFSKPVASDDDILDYIPTQFIAEFAKKIGYDGIAFRSSLTPELEGQNNNELYANDSFNVVVFNYDKCCPITSNIVNVTHNYLECEQIDNAPNYIDVRTTVLDMHY